MKKFHLHKCAMISIEVQHRKKQGHVIHMDKYHFYQYTLNKAQIICIYNSLTHRSNLTNIKIETEKLGLVKMNFSITLNRILREHS